ncbi:arylacetamide deacetylase-like 4 [Aplochiton taeniatus]
MDIGTAILIIGLAALFAAFLLLVIGLVYSELMNSDIPPGVANRRKLHVVHGLFVGIAIVGRILERLGLCPQVSFTRWVRSCFLVCRTPPPPGLRVRDLSFSGVPVRVYEPRAAPSKGLRRGLVYFHGGGWIMGSVDTADELCRHIAKEAAATVVSVGYRLAPEHRYPAPLDDCEAATCHFLATAAAELGVDPQRVAVGGDSAGANLATALCQRLAKREDGHLASPCAQVLIYPALQMADFNLPSYQQNHSVPVLSRGRAVFYFLQYLNGDVAVCQDVLEARHVHAERRQRYQQWLAPANLPPESMARGYRRPPDFDYDGEVYHIVKAGLGPEVSPLLVDDEVIRRSPPTFVLTCEYDVLRDDGMLYRKRLLDQGVAVTWHHVADGFHGLLGFLNVGWLTFPTAIRAADSVVSYVRTL